MSEATTAIAKLRNNKLNSNYRPMIFVIAPFTEIVKGDVKAIMAQFVHSSTYLNLLTCIIRKNFK